MYALLTVAAGGTIALLALWSLIRTIGAGGIIVNQIRFLASGLLLALHYPLVSLLSRLLEPYLINVTGLGLDYDVPFWAAVALLVIAQLIILPTGRELYATFLADRLARRTAV
jgi:hypothetical protein